MVPEIDDSTTSKGTGSSVASSSRSCGDSLVISQAPSSQSRKGKEVATDESYSRPPRPKEQDTDDLSSIYIPPDDEEIEHEGLEVLNETPPDEIEAGEADELPCRTLDNFTVFDQDNNNMIVDLSFLGAEGTDITISGDVESLDINELGEYYDTYQADIDEDDDFDDTGSNFDLERPGSASGFNDATCPRSAEHEPRSSRFVHRIRLSAILRYETYMVKGGDTEVWVCT
ncbi:hypothetical protein H4S06_006100, partial [Coemansia sp. BCRC 34490]